MANWNDKKQLWDNPQYTRDMRRVAHMDKPNKIVECDDVIVEFKPIYQHPFNGWEIVRVERK